MLVKYLGTSYSNKHEKWLPRYEFLENGFFRMTQPKFLNDKSEAKFYPYFDEYSPADMANARKRFYISNINPEPHEPSDEHLINFYLKPAGRRYSVEEFPTLLGFTEYDSVEKYNEAQRKNLVENIEDFNNFIIEALSCQFGVFSLSKSTQNKLMWTHYANNGEGLVVCFDKEHPFFKKSELQDVSYNKEDRASISYVQGTIRINGESSNHFKLPEDLNVTSLFKRLAPRKQEFEQLAKRLFYTKFDDWGYEKEMRIVMPLEYCEDRTGSIVNPTFDINMPEELRRTFPDYNEIFLKKISFDAMESIIFGYSTDSISIDKIVEIAKKNPELKHLKFKKAKIDVFGEVEINNL